MTAAVPDGAAGEPIQARVSPFGAGRIARHPVRIDRDRETSPRVDPTPNR